MDIFKLYRAFWDFCFEHPEKIKPNDVAIYSFAIEHCNRLGWKEKFGFPTSMVLEAVGIKSYSVYKKHFDNLVKLGFFEVVEYSRNQYSANIIALKENYKAPNKAHDKALDKALIKHGSKQLSKQLSKQVESKCSVLKQYNKEQYNKLTKNHIEVKAFLETIGIDENKDTDKLETFLSLWKETSFSQIRTLSQTRKSKILKRLETFSCDEIFNALKNQESLKDQSWFDLDFLIKNDENCEKVVNEKYKNMGNNGFNNNQPQQTKLVTLPENQSEIDKFAATLGD